MQGNHVYGAKVSMKKNISVYYGAKKTVKLKHNKKKVQWKVQNKKVAKIAKKSKNSVTVKGLKGGTTTIIAKVGKKSYRCKVKVKFKNAIQKAGSYNYSITPMLAPFDEFFYVKTDNPNVENIRFVDPTSKYYSGSKKGVMTLTEDTYYDVAYENKKTKRVKGGYIFTAEGEKIDGGTLVLQVYNKKSKKYLNTKVKVKCKAVKSIAQYVVDTYVKSSGSSFFNKMDLAQAKLETLSVYPRRFLDSRKKNKNTPYPFLATSPYKELWLNNYFRTHQVCSDYLFASDVYPFVLDSLSFPNTMKAIAKILAPSCSVKSGENHYEIDVTYNGTTKTYGGDGEGNYYPIYTADVSVNYLFNNSSKDISKKITLSSLKNTLKNYGKKADSRVSNDLSLLEGTKFLDKIGNGSWLRVCMEPFYVNSRPDTCYTYVSKDVVVGGAYYVEDCWVDGRYINANNQFCPGEKFKNHSTADILVKNQTYTTIQGRRKKGDLYYFHMRDGKWYAIYNYLDGDADLIQEGLEVPDEFILTANQVEQMQVDINTDINPKSGLIYDGTVTPGTAFKY